ncbi:MAG: DMT family transporter [Methylocella sp.]
MTRALWAMVGAMFCFSVANVCVRVITHLGVSSQQALFISTLGVATILGALLYRRLGWRGLAGTNRKTLFIRGLTGFGSAACFLYTLAHLRLADAAMIQYLNPLFVALLAPAINRERVQRMHWALLLVAVVGAALVLKPTLEYAPLPAVIGLCGAVFSAIAYSYVRALRKTEPEHTIIFYYVWISALFAFPGIGYHWVSIPGG